MTLLLKNIYESNAMFTRHNILTVYTPDNINVYIIKPLSEKEVLSILAHHEYLVL
jgi:allophanate hydrolase subunit 1